MADKSIGPGTVLAGRFRLEDLVQETAGAKFWRATDQTLARSVAVHVIDDEDPRAEALLRAARVSATVTDGHFLRVLDAARADGVVYVVNEWGSGISLDRILSEGPLSARRAAWLVKEVAEAITTAHRQGVAHGRLLPENVMVTEAGSVKLIGFVVDAVLNGRAGRPYGSEDPISEHESDVLNLAALLYAALVGRWPGTPGTSLPEAPTDHGRPLRPRQVRAGVPRPLDAVCDRVLNPDAHPQVMPLETAHEVCAALSDFIGDPAGVQLGGYEPTTVLDRDELGLHEPPTTPTTGAQAEPAAETEPGAGTEAGAGTGAGAGTEAGAATDAGAGTEATLHGAVPSTPSDTAGGAHKAAVPGQPAGPDPEATQAGAPVFFDDDTGVGWIGPTGGRGLRRGEDGRRRSAPPPPPFPDPEPRPLFAPDPPGARTRPERGSGWTGDQHTRQGAQQEPDRAPDQTRDRAGGRDPDWDTGSGATGHGTGHGTGSLPPVWGPDADQPEPVDRHDGRETRDAGKSWLQLAGILAGCVLLVVAIVVAFTLGRNTQAPPAETQSPSAGQSQTPPQPVRIAAVDDFDPQGDAPQEENPDLVPLATDGDPNTAWETLTYQGNPRLGLLKDGVGLRLDLGRETDVREVDLTLVGSPTSLQLLAADQGGAAAPSSVDQLRRVAGVKDAGTDVELTLKKPVTTRYLVVWLTSLPPYQDGYRGQVAEVTVKA